MPRGYVRSTDQFCSFRSESSEPIHPCEASKSQRVPREGVLYAVTQSTPAIKAH